MYLAYLKLSLAIKTYHGHSMLPANTHLISVNVSIKEGKKLGFDVPMMWEKP